MQNKNTGERETPAALPERETPAGLIHSTRLQDTRSLLQLSMNITALLLLLGLMAAAGSPVISCPEGCEAANYTHQYFQHVSDLHNNPVSPWKLTENKEAGRLPESIMYAHCTGCKNGMIAKPIFFQIYVYKSVNQTSLGGCRCPFELAVGCTCVEK